MRYLISVTVTGPNTQNRVQVAVPRPGWIIGVFPIVPANLVASQYPHGRAYGSLRRFDTPGPTLNGNDLGPLWAGYVTSVGEAGSHPNVYVQPPQSLRLDVDVGSKAVANDVVMFLVELADEPLAGAGSIFFEAPGAGVGELINIQGTNPAAGADFVWTTPAFARQRFRRAAATLTTAVAVANRVVSALLNVGGINGNAFLSNPAPAQAASLVKAYMIEPGYAAEETAFDANNQFRFAMPNEVWLVTNEKLSTSTTGIQAADQWSNIALTFEEWAQPY